ncbi:hypothetical protein BTA51_13320 [Hahella sp. CCB-MM4]|uniref:hypothetical protein n=1 Tax=Hahella sp. (strain CCB-MM4) TaxID=1926491 RepID=UPI000B9AFB38|nr:hypothetical protein [Hahella sp. CCB-MM4]OZG72935.1 hypothetical protein BTA51_13320 [Hahella sp. CCB-MM4]
MDYKKTNLLILFLLATFISGCSTLQPAEPVSDQGVDDIACVGYIQPPPPGASEASDQELLSKALGASGEGKLCEGKVFVANQPITVYRVWNSEKSYTEYGSWWSFSQPQGPKSKYREDNGICPSWSTLDRLSSCTIKVGAKFVVGPGQSAQCQHMIYAKSAVNQVFIPNDTRVNQVYVENCSEGVVWP